MKSGQLRKKNRKIREVEARANKPHLETRIFAIDSEDEIREDLVLISRAICQGWDFSEDIQEHANRFFKKILNSSSCSATVKTRVIELVVRIDRLAFNDLLSSMK